jgi:hypothetical protein
METAMAPRDHEGADRSARLILAGDEIHLAAQGRLVHIEGAERLAVLIERVLLLPAPAGLVPKVPVEAMRAMTRAGDRLRIETLGQRSAEPIEVAPQTATLFANLLSGHFNDRWTSESFVIELVNSGPGPCEVMLDLYLPSLGEDGGDAKRLTIRTDSESLETDIHRGGPTSVTLSVDTALRAECVTTIEPFQGEDARSRGVLVASLRDSAGQVPDVFHLSTYFD